MIVVDPESDENPECEMNGTSNETDFLDALLRSSENVRTGNDQLLKAVRTFERQFSSGQIEGVVFNDLKDLYSGVGQHDSSGSSIDENELMVGMDAR